MPRDPRADPRLSPLIDAALAGARVVMEVYGTDFSVHHKLDSSPVSAADVGSEHAIAERLRAAMPDVPIVAEEEMATNGAPKIGRTFLLVDPLDGTKEFISRNGEFTVNIALIEDGAPTIGVLLAPALGLAYAGSSAGAWKGAITPDLSRIDPWRPINARASGPHPVAVASRSHMNPATANALSQAACGEHRSIGSSLKFALLAEGEADFYPRLGPTMEWDTAAGDAVLRAGGGAVVTLEGTPLRYGKTGIEKKRDFENPHFIAAGDPTLLERLDLDAPSRCMSVTPLVLTTKGLDDYALLDSGHGRKLERFGARDARPAGGAGDLDSAALRRRMGEGGRDLHGRRRRGGRRALEAQCRAGGILDLLGTAGSASPAASPPSAMSARFPSRRRTGRSCASTSRLAGGTPSLLNLFGYTGLASLVAADIGAEVTHVDASKKAIAWARENQALSKLEDRPIRWITRRRAKIRSARGTARPALRRHPARSAEVRARAEERGLGPLPRPSGDAAALPRVAEARRLPHPHRLRDPRLVPFVPPAFGGGARTGRRIGRACAPGPRRRAARDLALLALDCTAMSDLPRPGSFKKITSLANPLVKDIRALQQKKHRDETGLFLAEGQKLVRDAVDGGWRVEMLAYAAASTGEVSIGTLAAETKASGGAVLEVSAQVLEKITRRENPQNVIGVFRQRLARGCGHRQRGESGWRSTACATPATSARSSAPPTRPASRAWRSSAPPATHSGWKRCARPWARSSTCRWRAPPRTGWSRRRGVTAPASSART